MTELISFSRQKNETGSIYRLAIVSYKIKPLFGKEKTERNILVASFGSACWRVYDNKYLPSDLAASIFQCHMTTFDFINFPTNTYA